MTELIVAVPMAHMCFGSRKSCTQVLDLLLSRTERQREAQVADFQSYAQAPIKNVRSSAMIPFGENLTGTLKCLS